MADEVCGGGLAQLLTKPELCDVSCYGPQFYYLNRLQLVLHPNGRYFTLENSQQTGHVSGCGRIPSPKYLKILKMNPG